MTNATVGVIHHGDEKNIKKIKLPVQDYIFEYNGIDIKKCMLEYGINYEIVKYFENGKAVNEAKKPVVSFCLFGKDDSGEECSIDFMLKMDMDDFNNLTDKLCKVTDKLVDGDMFFNNSYENGTELLEVQSEEDYYANPSNCWIAKVSENKFFVKLVIPTSHIFLWFKFSLEGEN